jgi:hypothetical protein
MPPLFFSRYFVDGRVKAVQTSICLPKISHSKWASDALIIEIGWQL